MIASGPWLTPPGERVFPNESEKGRPARRRSGPGLWVALACVLSLPFASGCDDGFSPIEPSELEFSIFGTLDASADTQWIRVMPIRPLVDSRPETLGLRVTLEEIGSGRRIEMRDSVFRFPASNPEFRTEEVRVLNFWTAERIEPGATYRFTAVRDGGRIAEAIVEVPPDYEVEILPLDHPNADSLRIVGLRNLVLVNAVSIYERGCIFQYPYPFERGDREERTMLIWRTLPPINECDHLPLVSRFLLVVGAATEWPAGLDTNVHRLGLPGAPTTATHSVGFVAGVVTKRIDYWELGGGFVAATAGKGP
jgi:hypothetical protein